MIDTTTIFARLDAAEKDAAQWRQLSGAEALAAALRRDYDKAVAAQAKADADAAKDAHAARFAGLSSIRVAVKPDQQGGGLLRQSFTIMWTALAYDMYSQISLPREHSCAGFMALPSNILAFLVEEHPDQIPAIIMALAPDDAEAAMERYFVGYCRGFFTSAAAA